MCSACDNGPLVTTDRTSAWQGLLLAKAMSLVWLWILSNSNPRGSPSASFLILPVFLQQAWWTVLGAWQDSPNNHESNKQNYIDEVYIFLYIKQLLVLNTNLIKMIFKISCKYNTWTIYMSVCVYIAIAKTKSYTKYTCLLSKRSWSALCQYSSNIISVSGSFL